MLDMSHDTVLSDAIFEMSDGDLADAEMRLDRSAGDDPEMNKLLGCIRLERVARRLERLPPEQFEMTDGLLVTLPDWFDQSDQLDLSELDYNYCGTAGCIAGMTMDLVLRESFAEYGDHLRGASRSCPDSDDPAYAREWTLGWDAVRDTALDYLKLALIAPEGARPSRCDWYGHELFSTEIEMGDGRTSGSVSHKRAAEGCRRVIRGLRPWTD